jgi:hypothetical protein
MITNPYANDEPWEATWRRTIEAHGPHVTTRLVLDRVDRLESQWRIYRDRWIDPTGNGVQLALPLLFDELP